MDACPGDVTRLLTEISDYLSDPNVTVESVLAERRRNRRRVLLIPGTTNTGRLCWCCAAHGTMHGAPHTQFVMCETCFRIDASVARALGLDHLLPITVRPRSESPEWALIDALGEAASEVSAVHLHPSLRYRWRQNLVHALVGELDLGMRYDYPLVEWTQEVGWSLADCAHRYASFLEVMTPELTAHHARLLDSEWIETIAVRHVRDY